jgi:hypothetical protein
MKNKTVRSRETEKVEEVQREDRMMRISGDETHMKLQGEVET